MDEEKRTFFEETRTLVEDYVEDRILLFKLQAGEKAAKLVSKVYIGLAIGLLMFIVLLIITVIAGYFLAFLTGNFIVGFGIIAALYVILIFVLYFMHKRFLGKRVMNAFIKLIFEKKEETNAI